MSRKKWMWGWQPASAECWVLLCCQSSASLAEVGESHASAHCPSCSCTCCWPSLQCSFIPGNPNLCLEIHTETLWEPKPELRAVGDLPLPLLSLPCVFWSRLRQGHAQCLSCSMLLGEKGKLEKWVFCARGPVHIAELQVYVRAIVQGLTVLLLLPLHTCSSCHTNIHGYICSFFSSWPQLRKKICAPKQKKKSISDLCISEGWGTLIWTTPHLDHGHSVFSFLTCMAPWPLDPSPVTSCKKMPGCTLGASAASLRIWCTSSLTKNHISLWGYNFPVPLLLLYYVVVINLEKQGLQNISLRILLNPHW